MKITRLKNYELRGLTFVFDDFKQEWTRHLLLNKFFNINQCSMDNLLELEIKTSKGKRLIKVNETHIFKVKSNLGNISNKLAKDLTENDNIVGWDELKNV